MFAATKNPEARAVSEDPSSLSAGSKARFNGNAIRDEETGEQYLGPDQFIDAIAPVDEDYVRCPDRRRRRYPSTLQPRSCALSPTSTNTHPL